MSAAGVYRTIPHPLYGELRVKRIEYCSQLECEAPAAWLIEGWRDGFCYAHGPGNEFYRAEESWAEAFSAPSVQQLDLFGEVRPGVSRRKWVAA